MAALAKTNVIVMFSSISQASLDRPRFRGQTQLLSVTPSNRFVQVRIRVPAQADALVAMLAHELQHVLELAGSTAKTHAEWEAYLQTTADKWERGVFETTAALDLERSVLADLRAGKTP